MKNNYDKDKLVNFVDRIAVLHDSGYLPFLVHLAGGNENELIDIFEHINENDYVLSTHRNMYHALLHGIPEDELENKILNAKSMFVFDRKRNFYVSAIIGGTPAIAVGIAWALKRKNSSQKVYCFVGDGIEDTGHFYEAVRYVDGFDLPCVFVIEDDGIAASATKSARWNTDKEFNWPKCVLRYKYTKTKPHARTGNFADVSVMKKVKKTEEEYFPVIPPVNFNLENLSTELSYKDANALAMKELGDDGSIFIGYSLIPGDAMGTIKDVPDNQKIETPICENLMVGMAIGMSFEGFKPVVYFERHDFMLVAADAICNHLDKIERISLGEYKCPVILKTVVDDGDLFYSGPTHRQNFTSTFKEMINFPVLEPHTPGELLSAYRFANNHDGPVMVVEHKKYF